MPDVGEIMGRYKLLKKFAVGGMGEIFLAAKSGPLGMGAPVALKVLREEFTQDQNFVDMLVDEANICRFLNHQNVVSVTDFGQDLGTYYIAMEYVQGVTLQYVLEKLREHRKRMPLGLSLFIQMELCRALRYAHTKKDYGGEPLNIVHRDVTPGNLLLSIQGEVKLTDFGIARAKGRNHKTQAGILKGKFGYMAPEMIRQEEIDARADIFCAGIVLYEMLATRHPVHGASLIEAITAFEQQSYKPPSAYNKQLPKVLDEVVMKALAPQPDSRWSNAAEFANALQNVILNDKAIRSMANGGGPYLSKLIKKFNPQIFENQIPDIKSTEPVVDNWAARPEPKDALSVTPAAANASHNDTINSPARNQDDSEQPTAHVLDGIREESIPAPSLDPSTNTASNTSSDHPAKNSSKNTRENPLSEDVTMDAGDLNPQELQMLVQAGMNQPTVEPPQDVGNSTLSMTPNETVEPTTGTPLLQGSEVRPMFEEGIIPATANPAESNEDYDDGPTAFVPAPESENQTNEVAAYQDITNPVDIEPAKSDDDYHDATLLDGISLADVEAAKLKYEQEHEASVQPVTEPPAEPVKEIAPETVAPTYSDQTDENIDATRIRFDVSDLEPPAPSALAQLSASAKALDGPLRIKVPEESHVPMAEASTHLSLPAESNAAFTAPETTAPAEPAALERPAATQAALADTHMPMPVNTAPEPTAPAEPASVISAQSEPVAATVHTPQPHFPAHTAPAPVAPQPTVSVIQEPKRSLALPILTVFVVSIVVASCFLLISDRFWPRLTLTTTPSGAQILLNQRQTKGQSPVTLILKPFVAHELEFKLEGHRAETRVFKGSLNTKRLMNVQLIASQHFILVSPRPGRIFINDRKIGTADRKELPPLDALGQIEIKVEAAGYKTWTRTFKSSAEVPYQLKVRLKEKN